MVQALESALATHLINTLRDSRTGALHFRKLISHLTLLLSEAAIKDDALCLTEIPTWKGSKRYERIDESKMLIVTVLRAGLPMLEAMMEFFPGAEAGFLGIKRDETTQQAHLYYDRLPDCRGKHLFLVDPMVATGGSLIEAMRILTDRNAESITSLNIIGSPEGLKRVESVFPELPIYVASIDAGLDENGFVIPGLGDAGDRSYNTSGSKDRT